MEKKVLIPVLLAMLVLGMVLGYFVLPRVAGANVPAEAKVYARKVRIDVYDEVEGQWFKQTFDISNSYVKVLFSQTGGQALELGAEIDWQIVLGMEDHPQNGRGDFADTILKIIKGKDGGLWFEVSCLGTFHKKVYYNDALKMEAPASGGSPRVSWVAWTA